MNFVATYNFEFEDTRNNELTTECNPVYEVEAECFGSVGYGGDNSIPNGTFEVLEPNNMELTVYEEGDDITANLYEYHRGFFDSILDKADQLFKDECFDVEKY